MKTITVFLLLAAVAWSQSGTSRSGAITTFDPAASLDPISICPGGIVFVDLKSGKNSCEDPDKSRTIRWIKIDDDIEIGLHSDGSVTWRKLKPGH